jgi:hypothetical protein
LLGSERASGVVTNLYFGTLLGLSAQFPSGYITASMSGIGLGGMAVGVIRLITFFALPSNDEGYRKTAYVRIRHWLVGSLCVLFRDALADLLWRGGGCAVGGGCALLVDAVDLGVCARASD